MTTREFSDGFDSYVSSYRRFKDFDKKEELDSIEFNEYEKSLFLTQAQDESVVGLYSGRNAFGESFEATEELRRYLEPLVKQIVYANSDRVEGEGVSSSSVFYNLPSDIAYIIYEKVTFANDLGCLSGISANVYPVTHDEYNRVARNPFRGPTVYKALRLDAGNGKVEIISAYRFSSYQMRYLSKPSPIVLEDMPEGVSVNGADKEAGCALPETLHDTILRRACELALASKGIQVKS